MYALVHKFPFWGREKKNYLEIILPCIYQTVTTPLDTGHSIGVACKGNDTLPRGNVPNTCIAIFTCTYETAGRRLQMNWLPRYSSNPLSVSLQWMSKGSKSETSARSKFDLNIFFLAICVQEFNILRSIQICSPCQLASISVMVYLNFSIYN
jgi:hypothetical protein